MLNSKSIAVFSLASFVALTSSWSPAEAAPAGGGGGGGGAGGGKNIYLDLAFAPVISTSNNSVHNYGGTLPVDTGDVAPDKTTGYDLKGTLGYAFGGEYLVGLSYNLYNSTTKRDAVVNGGDGRNSTTSKAEYGPTVGILMSGWKVAFTYLLAAEATNTDKYTSSTGATTTDQTTKNTKGTGFMLNVGYSLHLTQNIQLGPSLIYRSVTYGHQALTDKQNPINNYDSDFSTKATESSLSPYFSATLRF